LARLSGWRLDDVRRSGVMTSVRGDKVPVGMKWHNQHPVARCGNHLEKREVVERSEYASMSRLHYLTERPARLQDNRAGVLLFKERDIFVSSQLALDLRLPGLIDGMHLEDRLGGIEADHTNVHWGGSFLWVNTALTVGQKRRFVWRCASLFFQV
jgi:hypothetical protein